MAALTRSRSTIVNAGSLLLVNAFVRRARPFSSASPSAVSSPSGNRTWKRWSAGGPYRCTTSSPGSGATACLTSSTVTADDSNFDDRGGTAGEIDPARKAAERHRRRAGRNDKRRGAQRMSSPAAEPEPRSGQESTRRRKAEALRPTSLPAQRDLEQRPRHEDSGEYVSHQANRQRGCKSANRAGAELIQKRRGNERGDM